MKFFLLVMLKMAVFSLTLSSPHQSMGAVLFPHLIPTAFSAAKKPKESSEPTKNKSNKKDKAKVKTKKLKNFGPKDKFFTDQKLEKIYLRIAKRVRRIYAFKKKGVVGEADNGLLKIRQTQGLSKDDKELLEKLVKVENSDRNIIFQKAVEGTNPTKKEIEDIRLSYFETQLMGDESGIYYFRADHWHIK